jgi:hypothetical protein
MSAKCRKKGCEKGAIESLVRVTDLYRRDVDAEVPFGLCEEHLKKAQKRFPETDGIGLMKWLDS